MTKNSTAPMLRNTRAKSADEKNSAIKHFTTSKREVAQ